MKCEQTESGWTIFEESLRLYLETEGFRSFGKRCFQKNGRKFFILPLCQLESLRDLRKKVGENGDYDSPAIFLITGKGETPYVDKRNMSKSDREELFGNPKFGNIAKAILLAEAATDETSEKSYGNWPFQNVINVTNGTFPANLIQLIENHKNIIPDFGKYRREFYATFIDYYYVDDVNLRDISQAGGRVNFKTILDKMLKSMFVENNDKKYNKLSPLSENDVDSIITCADIIYCYLNDINYNDFTHRVDHELFRAPIPFPLQELVNAKNEIGKELKEDGVDKKIKLLLTDNRSDKFIAKDVSKPESLCDLLFSEDDGFGLDDIFEIQMLGNAVYKKKNGISGFYENYKKDTTKNDYSHFKEEYEVFKFKKFNEPESFNEPEKKYHKEFILGKKNINIKIDTYLDLVYQKVKDAHVVLLDFFLNEENTYLAFDFIKDMAEIKKQKGDSSTTWYFITSAVYDSVVKYSQSGLLAEYYESAVVSAGDDPTNNKRQIIFLYKLLTFINARLNSFKGYKDSIMKCRMFNNKACGHSNDYYRKPENCLFTVQSLCRKYTAEYNEITEIFPGTKEKEFKEIVELLENIITQFLWLPEADWHMIQRQIEFLDVMLQKKAPEKYKKHKFSCKYILEEMVRRSRIY